MPNFVMVKEAQEQSSYTGDHIRLLIRQKVIAGKKVGGIWLVDLDGLLEYEKRMAEAGKSKHRPKFLDKDDKE